MCVAKIGGAATIDDQSVRTKPVPNLKLLNESGTIDYEEDLLAVSTHYLKIAIRLFNHTYRSFQNSIFYSILFNTTQPAHLVTVLSVLTICYMMVPADRTHQLKSPLLTLVYLASFSLHFGAQIWMTFVSGLSLYFALPRHTFGNVQRILFPKYFLLNSILSLITLIIFLKSHNQDLASTEITVQAAVMTVCFLVELVIRLYLTPPLLRLMSIKNQIEAKAGSGMEIGKHVPGPLLQCPHYLQIHKSFRKVHMIIAIGNIIAMGCTMAHVYYLSRKLCML